MGVTLTVVCLSPNATEVHRLALNNYLSAIKEHTVIVADFNHPHIEWEVMSGPQSVDFLTHVHDNILDLILTNEPNSVQFVSSRPELSVSDHVPLEFYVKVGNDLQKTRQLVPDSSHGDYDAFRSFLLQIDWVSVLP
eukprot:TCALIF_13878-PA protein Name:"Protein of unknown function" AED:0.29 eAED:0.31 QI:0/0/0/1/0/0/3/0/136